jgi:hypothetical protein
VAEIVTVSLGLARFVLTVNVAEVLPFGIVTETGTLALLSLLESETVTPLDGAGEPRVTVPVEAPPALTVFGLKVRDARLGGSTVSVALADAPFNVAVSIAAVSAATGVVLIVKLAESFPGLKVTVLETIAALVPLDRFTLSPPDGAGPERVTDPVAEAPPSTDAGLTSRPISEGGSTVSVAD